MKVYSLEKMRNKRDKRQDLRLCEALGENAGNHLGYGLVFFLVLICCEFCESLFESRQNVTQLKVKQLILALTPMDHGHYPRYCAPILPLAQQQSADNKLGLILG